MRRLMAILIAGAAVLALSGQFAEPARASGPRVLVVDIERRIDPLTVGYITRGIDRAEESEASLLVIRLDTPGGLVESTRDIVRVMVDAETPIAVLVSPAGARASSAGTFVTAAAHFAVMTAGTHIGAASVVGADGEDLPETMARKIDESDSAFIRSIAELRGRNAAALEDTVLQTKAYSAQEALDLGIIDFLAPDLETMLQQLDGRTAQTAAGARVVATAGAQVENVDNSTWGHATEFLANTNLVFILLVLGGFAILVELAVPGLFGPGVSGAIGVVLLVLAFIGFINLPGNWLGIALIGLAMILFYFETTAPGFSLFGGGGILSIILGAVFLFGNVLDTPSIPEPVYMVSPIVIAVMSGMLIAMWVVFIRLVFGGGGSAGGFHTKEQTQLEGAVGVALSGMQPSGKVRISGEEWIASANPGVSIRKGDEVRVVGVYGEVLKVEKLGRKRRR